MAEIPHACDSYRLRLSLEDRLSDAEQPSSGVPSGDLRDPPRNWSDWPRPASFWGDARLLRGEAEPGATPDHRPGAGTLEPDDDQTDADAEGGAWIDFLDPPDPDRPGHSGPAGSLRGSRGARARRHGRGAQGA